MTFRTSIFSVQDHYPGRGRSIAQLYEQVLAQAEFAEAEGYDTFFVAEHHFHEYGVVPNPLIMLSAMSQRTRRIRLGTAISILTFHDPLTVAEGYAMVDVLSGGRLTLGVGSGYLKHEFEGYGIHPAEKRERFDENLAIVEKALAGPRRQPVHHRVFPQAVHTHRHQVVHHVVACGDARKHPVHQPGLVALGNGLKAEMRGFLLVLGHLALAVGHNTHSL